MNAQQIPMTVTQMHNVLTTQEHLVVLVILVIMEMVKHAQVIRTLIIIRYLNFSYCIFHWKSFKSISSNKVS